MAIHNHPTSVFPRGLVSSVSAVGLMVNGRKSRTSLKEYENATFRATLPSLSRWRSQAIQIRLRGREPQRAFLVAPIDGQVEQPRDVEPSRKPSFHRRNTYQADTPESN